MINELLIKNVRIMDALTGKCSSNTDIWIEEGIIKQIAGSIDIEAFHNFFDAKGAFVSVGWIDSHTHFDLGEGLEGFDIMRTYPPDGVTYAVDAGSRGPACYESMYRKIIASPINLKTYLYVANDGCKMNGIECRELTNIDPKFFQETYEKHKDLIIGVKIRIDPRVNCDTKKTLRIAQDIATNMNLPLIIHPTRCEDSLEEILSVLKKGDVMAHTYSGLKPCILDQNGKLRKCVLEARERGVYFDLSHGSSNFSWEVGKRAVEQQFLVDVISTDLHEYNISGPVCCIADTMSKCLHIGMSIEDVIRRVTVNAAKMLGIKDKQLTVKEGSTADLTIFKIEEGSFKMSDSMSAEEECRQRIVPLMTVFEKMVFYPRNGIHKSQDY